MSWVRFGGRIGRGPFFGGWMSSVCLLFLLGGCFRLSYWEQVCIFPLQLMRASTHTLERRA